MIATLFSRKKRVNAEKQVCPACHGKKFQEIQERCVTMCREGLLFDNATQAYTKPCPYRARYQEFTLAYQDISEWPDEKVCDGSGQLRYVCWKCKGKGVI